MELRFTIHSHCHDDMIIFLKEFLIIWAIAHLRDAFKKCHNERDLAYCYYQKILFDSTVDIVFPSFPV
jgi:hypothetical protein